MRLRGAADELAAMSKAFLNWSGKDGGPQLSVPTLPLFVHERLSTQAVLESVRGMKRTKVQALSLFADEGLDIDDRIFGAYEHAAPWTNRLILRDSLAVMNSLLEYEGLGGKVQMIYIDPPYGVKFGSNFQPFVRKREVKHGDDGDLTREPEMVQAYRDTWELGLHSYLTYMRDRLTVGRELLHPIGSIFVQISDENLHQVREVLDEVFGAANAIGIITFAKTSGATSELMPAVTDYLLWYAKDHERVKYQQLYLDKTPGAEGGSAYTRAELPDGTRRPMTAAEQADPTGLPSGSRIYTLDNLTSQSMGREKGEGAASWFPVELDGKTFLTPLVHEPAAWAARGLLELIPGKGGGQELVNALYHLGPEALRWAGAQGQGRTQDGRARRTAPPGGRRARGAVPALFSERRPRPCPPEVAGRLPPAAGTSCVR